VRVFGCRFTLARNLTRLYYGIARKTKKRKKRMKVILGKKKKKKKEQIAFWCAVLR